MPREKFDIPPVEEVEPDAGGILASQVLDVFAGDKPWVFLVLDQEVEEDSEVATVTMSASGVNGLRGAVRLLYAALRSSVAGLERERDEGDDGKEDVPADGEAQPDSLGGTVSG